MAYRRSSNGEGLLSDRNISTNYFISYVHDCEWRLEECRLDKNSPRSQRECQREELHTRARFCLLGSSGLTAYGSASH
jgi:hypothetical protein